MTALRVTFRPEDARGIVQMSPRDMQARGVSVGGTVRINGPRAGLARVAPGLVDEGTLAVDQMVARNCDLAEGAEVSVTAEAVGPLAHLLLRLDPPVPARPSDLQDALFDMALGEGDTVEVALPNGRKSTATVCQAAPWGLVGANTQIALESRAEAIDGFEKIGGLTRQVQAVHEMIAAPLLRPDLFARLGVDAPRGVLFTGPPGSGKTLLARTVAQQTKAAFFQIDGPEILSKHYGESEAALRQVFDAASKAQPAIIFIDEIDSLAPKRDGLSGEKQLERRIVAQLLTLMDGIADRGQVVVMAATNLPDGVDPALRRPGRFDREITFLPPSDAERQEILAIHLAHAPLAEDVDLARIASAAKGYVGADLAALAREAAMAALARAVATAGSEAAVKAEELRVDQSDLEQGLAASAPSLLRSSGAVAEPLSWDDIGGLDAVKAQLKQAVDWPETQRDAIAALGLSAPRGILLTGPPGSGKTMLARALAGEASLNFIPVRPPDLVSQFLGEAEKAVMAFFHKARLAAPSLLFFDEFDALAPRRGTGDPVFERIVAQLLVEIDGVTAGRGVTVLAASNRAASIDPAFLRPGRFDLVFEMAPPDFTARQAILQVHLDRRQGAAMDATALADATEGLTGADLAGLVERAAWSALERAVQTGAPPELTQSDIDAALAAHGARAKAAVTDFISAPEGPS